MTLSYLLEVNLALEFSFINHGIVLKLCKCISILPSENYIYDNLISTVSMKHWKRADQKQKQKLHISKSKDDNGVKCTEVSHALLLF